jgi:hypothetical protein
MLERVRDIRLCLEKNHASLESGVINGLQFVWANRRIGYRNQFLPTIRVAPGSLAMRSELRMHQKAQWRPQFLGELAPNQEAVSANLLRQYTHLFANDSLNIEFLTNEAVSHCQGPFSAPATPAQVALQGAG